MALLKSLINGLQVAAAFSVRDHDDFYAFTFELVLKVMHHRKPVVTFPMVPGSDFPKSL